MYDKFEKFGLGAYPPEIRGRFNSFITTQFDDSLSVEMQIRSIVKWAINNFDETVNQTNHFIDFINDLIDYMNNFIETFDEKYQETILDKMQEWYNNGELETLINESLDTKYHEMDNRLTTQLVNTHHEATRKKELEDLSETVLTAIEGGEGTSFNLLSIPQNNSVSEHKTTFIEVSRNLMNPNHLEEGYFTGSGNVAEHELYYRTTDFPRTNGVKKLTFQPNDNSVVSIVFYDSAKQFIGYATNDGDSSVTTFDVPDGSYHFNVSFSKNRLDRFMIEYGETQSSYEAFYYSEFDSNLMLSLMDESKNLMNPNLLGSGYLGTTGQVNEHNIYRYTENYIPTKRHRWLSFQPNLDNVVINIQFYDSNRNFVGYDTNDLDKENIKRFEVPKNAHYFRISFNASRVDEFMVEYGLHQSDYEPYRKPTFIEPFSHAIEDEKEDVLNVVCFGDSNTATKVETGKDYPSVIREQTGWTVHNVGFGGARMGKHPTTRYNNFCMHRLAEAVATQDFTEQEADTTGADHYANHLNTLKNINFNDVDVVTIAYGTNDWGGGHAPPSPIDNPENPYDRDNFIGAMRYSIKTLLEAYPHLKILIITPFYRFDTSSGQDSDDGWRPTYNPNHSLQEYVQAEIETAYEMKVPSVDMYNTSGINKYNRTHYFSATDGVHLNVNATLLVGTRVIGEIKRLYVQ